MDHEDMHRSVGGIAETLQFSRWVFSKFGLFSKNKFKKYFLVTILNLCLINLLVIAMVQFVNIKNKVPDFLRNLETIFGFPQAIGKIFLVTYHIEDFLKLIETTSVFWNSNKCNQETARKVSSIYHFIHRLQRVYQLLFIIDGVGIIITPLLKNVPPLGIWTLHGHQKLYYFVVIEQIVAVLCSGIFLLGLELMYLGFCIEIIVQFKILCNCIEELTAGGSLDEMEVDYLNKLKTCIQHHQFILWFIKKFQKSFSLILLVQYLTTCPLVCAELFVVFDGTDFQLRLRHFILFLALAFQLFIYCIPADYVAEEALTVANAVYFSKWYIYFFPSLKKPLLIMMQNSQKEIITKAGDLVPINTETFVTVLKVAWSACSLMRGLKQN